MSLGSYLLYGGAIRKRSETALRMAEQLDPKFARNSHPDLLIIDREKGKNSIGIDQTRNVLSFLFERPYSSKFKVVMIYHADAMTAQAQNSLLKTLEEPPSYAAIYLLAKTENSLLPTVISRCRKIVAKSEWETLTDTDFIPMQLILHYGVGERMELAEKTSKKEKDEVITILENWIGELRTFLLNHPKSKTAEAIVKMQEIKNSIEDTNMNVRLALEWLLLNIPDNN